MFKTIKSKKFIKKYNLDSTHFENIRMVLDMFALQHQEYVIPSVQGGFWRRWLDNEPFETMNGDIDFYNCADNSRPHLQSQKVFTKFICENFNGTNEVNKIDFEKLETHKNISVDVLHLRETPITFQVMGDFFSCGSNSNKNAVIKSIKRMDSYVNMIGYDFYSDSFIIHDYTYPCIKNKHYKINDAVKHCNPKNIMQRMVKFTKMGYDIKSEDYTTALEAVKIDTKEHYDFNSVNVFDTPNSLNSIKKEPLHF